MSPPGSDQGVSAHQIKIAIILSAVAGAIGNQALGAPTPNQQQQEYQDVIDSINASGGAACHQLIPVFFQANPADPSTLQAACLDVNQAQVFAVLDTNDYNANPSLATCYPSNHLPFFSPGLIPNSERLQGYPYLMYLGPTEDLLYRNAVFAFQKMGEFSARSGFHKLGIFYETCAGNFLNEATNWLHQAGLSDSQIVSYNGGCPSGGFGSPSNIEQAVLTFQQAGVTAVTELGAVTDMSTFTKLAAQQTFHPQYLVPDDFLEEIAVNPALGVDPTNFNNAITISGFRYGEETTPGYAPTAGTAKCNGIFKARGISTTAYAGLAGSYLGWVCDLVWAVTAAVDRAPALNRADLALGLESAGSLDLSFPLGPANYAGSMITSGGQFWRPGRYLASCKCFQLIDPSFQPSFP